MARRRFSIVTFLAATALACGLWSYVALMRSYEDDLVIPLVVIAPPNQAMLSTVPATVSVRVRASGLQLINARYFTTSSACTLDLRKMRTSDGTTYVLEGSDLMRNIVSTLPLRTIAVTPNALTLATGDLFSKRVPLRVRTNIACRHGFVTAGAPLADVQDVEVRGTKRIVESITEWHTQRISLEDVHDPVVVDVQMSDSLMTLVNVVPSSTRVRINVQQEADKVIADVPVKVPTSRYGTSLIASPTLLRVTIRGGVEDVSSITRNNIEAEITEHAPSGRARPRIHLVGLARVVSLEPAFVHVVTRSVSGVAE